MAANAPNAARGVLVIPAFNEAPRLATLLERIRVEQPALEVVVVDDGSRDATAQIAAQAGATVLRHPFNLGYGAGLQTGYKYAVATDARFVVQMDADGQHDPRDIARLLEPLERGECDLVIGSRFLAPTGYEMGFLRTLGRRFFVGLARSFGIRVTDPTSGFQALGKRVLALYVGDAFPSDYPDVDVLLTAHRHGLEVRECSVEMHASPRKSTLHGGLRSIWYLYKMLLAVWAASGGGPNERRPDARAPA
ncbi:MAG TPA: glycosyltransferase family 2 protein [Myxococcota bacterium]|nr:glycosyltransferase family 2 protein [Myxococcota bacterium]